MYNASKPAISKETSNFRMKAKEVRLAFKKVACQACSFQLLHSKRNIATGLWLDRYLTLSWLFNLVSYSMALDAIENESVWLFAFLGCFLPING